MSLQFKNIVGNTDLITRIADDIQDKTLSHAYIVEGQKGSGKHTLALNIAAAVCCSENNKIPCGKCKNCEKILSGKSPDILIYGREEDKATIGVGTARKIREDIAIAPNDLDLKVYIIEDADSMTSQAQNALLLSLEDPPQYVIFFLLCESSYSLLETIRSRAPSLRLQKLTDKEVKHYILEHDKRAVQLQNEDPETFDLVVFISNGCIGKAIELLDTRKRKALLDERSVAENIISLLSAPNRLEAVRIISSFKNKRADALRCTVTMQYALRDLILLKKNDNAPLSFYPDRQLAQERSTHCTSMSLMSLYDALQDAARALESNANVRLTLMNMMQKAGLM